MASNTEMRSIFTLGGIRMFSSTFLAFAFRNENNHGGKTVQLTVGIKSTRFPEAKVTWKLQGQANLFPSGSFLSNSYPPFLRNF